MNDIKRLIDRYYAGLTSLEEEKRLREYFNRSIPPESLNADDEEMAADEMVFNALGDCPDFGAMAEKASEENPPMEERKASLWARTKRWRVAASVALIAGAGVTAMWIHTPPAVESEPGMTVAEATEHTRRALTLFANAVNRSRESVWHAETALCCEKSTDNEMSN